MQYKLVNVTGVRETPFTGELIIEGDDMFGSVVGLFENSKEGNVAPGVSIFNVPTKDIEDTGETIDRFPVWETDPDEPLNYTPQLV